MQNIEKLSALWDILNSARRHLKGPVRILSDVGGENREEITIFLIRLGIKE